MFQIATLWWILNQTSLDQSLLMTLFLVMSALPGIMFVNFIGAKIESTERKKILQTVDGIGFIISIGLLFFSFNEMSGALALCLASFIFSLLLAFIEPGLMKIVNEISDEKDIPQAVGFLTSTQTIAYFMGAILGAMLIDKVGLEGIIIINGLTFGISFIIDGLLKITRKIPLVPFKKGETPSATALLSKMGTIRKVVLLFAAINLFMAPISMIIAFYTKSILNGQGATLGVLEAFLTGGLLLGTIIGARGEQPKNIYAFIGTTVFVFGLALIAPYIWALSAIYAVSLLISGTSLGIVNVKIINHFQTVISDDIKGRFFAVLRGLASAAVPIGYLVFGAMSHSVSADVLCLIQGLGILSMGVVFLLIKEKSSQLVLSVETASSPQGGS